MRNISFFVIMLLAVFGGGCVATGSGKDSISKWIGSYESVSGSCGELRVQESKITWGSCKEASTKLISVSASELVMEVDPSANGCGWAGFIVSLGSADSSVAPQITAPKITISAYQTLEDYKTANRFVQCTHFKKEQ